MRQRARSGLWGAGLGNDPVYPAPMPPRRRLAQSGRISPTPRIGSQRSALEAGENWHEKHRGTFSASKIIRVPGNFPVLVLFATISVRELLLAIASLRDEPASGAELKRIFGHFLVLTYPTLEKTLVRGRTTLSLPSMSSIDRDLQVVRSRRLVLLRRQQRTIPRQHAASSDSHAESSPTNRINKIKVG